MTKKTPIPISSIESELSKLWENQEKHQKIKAHLFNLIIYAHDLAQADHFRAYTSAITEKCPCRILFITRSEDISNHQIHVTVSNEPIGDGSANFACDQIEMTCSEAALQKIPFVILPHLVPDLPVYLLWGQDPTLENPIFSAMQEFADRIIFDAQCGGDLQGFVKKMLELMQSTPVEVMDMNWALVSGWRDIMTLTFDNFEHLTQLADAVSVTLHFMSSEEEWNCQSATQAIYLQGWIAAQMKWELLHAEKAGNQYHIHYNGGTHPTTVVLNPVKSSTARPGSVNEIEVESAEGYVFSMKRSQQLAKVDVHVSNLDQCELPFSLPLPNMHQGFHLMKETFYHKVSPHYKAMLEKIQNIRW